MSLLDTPYHILGQDGDIAWQNLKRGALISAPQGKLRVPPSYEVFLEGLTDQIKENPKIRPQEYANMIGGEVE